ncbi:hypothetical protein PF008_g21585 [Phytophthora fragariae]|uniref:Uncharacterized protein n=1 Tax=Phytophthora fragariae TaxID=53985 RepID=A0A6G0QW64_9STRA|nr:hypothetical protein PF008_g21585 [Phytophthora fragariae]
MSKSKLSDSVVDKLSFHGNKNLFAAYKEKLKAHLKAMSDALVVTELQAKRRRPVARYEDALVQEPVLEEPGPGASVEDQEYYVLQVAFANNQQSHVKNLFNLTLPSGFVDDKLMQKPVHKIWRAIENSTDSTPLQGLWSWWESLMRLSPLTSRAFPTCFGSLRLRGTK